VTLFGFVRIVTNRRIFDRPRSVEEALADVQSWLDAGAVLERPALGESSGARLIG